MLQRRGLLGLCAATAVACLMPKGAKAATSKPEVGDNGLYVQDWFVESFLDLREDHGNALRNGKHLAVLFEQRGCPYCRQLHTVNLADAEIKAYIQSHFDIVQLDLLGSRTATDFDGSELEERALARRWGIGFTPTTVFLAKDADALQGKSGRQAEIARMPGYLKPFQFVSFFEFVQEGAYATLSFQDFLREKLNRLGDRGVSPKD